MKSATSVTNMTTVIPRIILFLFQMAILPGSLSALLRKDDRNAWETYTRSKINNEEVENAT